MACNYYSSIFIEKREMKAGERLITCGLHQDILDLFKENNEQPFRPSRMLGGLSLTAVKLIMDAHGGSMALSNQPDGGARVCLKFNLFDN